MTIRYSRPDRQHIVQIAYHVTDIDTAIGRWHAMFGLGPFVVRRHIGLKNVLYRGTPETLDISAAHAQTGDVQIELVTQHCDRPSAFRDMFSPAEEGLHHVAMFPADHDAMVAHFVANGAAPTTELITAEGRGATYVDTRPLCGHMTEIYRINDSLIEFYRLIAEAARAWDGHELVIEL